MSIARRKEAEGFAPSEFLLDFRLELGLRA
jgi:hypothetical protein